ncbi:MAG: sigma-70 family RNA polymerase sigma factor [Oscillochloridaceae bacterium umkhey_bin13]
MLRKEEIGHPWAEFVTELSTTYGWNLCRMTVLRYCAALADLLPPQTTPDQIRIVCRHYHQDHHEYAALQSSGHPDHTAAWQRWLALAVPIVVKACGTYPGQPLLDPEDLAQMALLELARCLDRFRFQSSLTTWAYAVIAQTALRLVRDGHAKKRPQTCTSLDQCPGWEEHLAPVASPEVTTQAWALAGLVHSLLLEHGDARLAQIFLLSAADQSTETIGRLVQLHPSRVRALLTQARSILQADPTLRAWRN